MTATSTQTSAIPLWFQYVDCVLLDDGGFLVMSNKDEDLSKVGSNESVMLFNSHQGGSNKLHTT